MRIRGRRHPPSARVSTVASPLVVVAACLLVAGCGGSSDASPVPTSDGLQPRGETDTGLGVIRVVDGDTLHVNLDGQDVTVRLIGIDTPETVKSGSPVECFGPEASDFAKRSLSGQTVTLEYDASQGRADRFGRTLAYAWIELPDGGSRLFNLDAVAGGYAEERQYGANRFAWQSEFRKAEVSAQEAGIGRWGACGS